LRARKKSEIADFLSAGMAGSGVDGGELADLNM
jgi:hypothetical protein